MKDVLKRYKYLIFVTLSFFILDIMLRVVTKNYQYVIYNYLFDISWILLFLGFIIILKGKYKNTLYSLIMFMFIGFFIANSLCNKFFNVVCSVSKIGLAEKGSKYVLEILNSVPLISIITLIVTIILFVIANKKFPKDVTKLDKRLSLMFLMIGLFTRFITINALGVSLDETDYKSLNNIKNIYNNYININKAYSISGLYEYTFNDLYKSIFKENKYDSKKLKKEIDNYLVNKEHVYNDYTNIFKDKNLILVMMESMDEFLITESTMPTLYKLKNTGINFSNHYSPSFGGGDTFNSEYSINTGLLPITHGGHISYTYRDNTYPYSLPNLFRLNGYKAESYHFNESTLYDRGVVHKNIGYEKYNGLIEMGIDSRIAEKDSIFMTNDDVYKSIVKDDKFMSFIITYTGHMRYSKKNTLCSDLLKEDIKENEELECLQAQAKETDNMFKLLIDRLDSDDKLKDTVIVAITDHYAFGIYDTKKLYELKGTSDKNMLSKTPFIIWSEDIENEEVKKFNVTVDILPTLVNMFGLTNNYKNYFGNDIFDDKNGGLAYFSDLSWYDGVNYYKDEKLVKGNKNIMEINRINKTIYDKLRINENIIITDYFNE